MKIGILARSFMFLLLLVFTQNAFSKDYKVLTLDDHSSNNHFSFELNLGGGQGFKEIYTGFVVDDGSIAVFFPGGGLLAGCAFNFFHGNRLQYGLSYQFQSGGLNQIYENATDANNRNVLIPTIRFAPVVFGKAKINVGAGINLVISNHLKITAELPGEIQEVLYTFKNNVGPNFFLEYQQNYNKWSGWRIGLTHSRWEYELDSFNYNNIPVDINYAPYEMQYSKAGSIHLYFGVYVYI